jgi:hypothetical protein
VNLSVPGSEKPQAIAQTPTANGLSSKQGPAAWQTAVPHIAAGLCVSGFFAALTLILYFALVLPSAVSAHDLGGPLLLMIVPVIGGSAGICVSTFAFFPLSLLAMKRGFRVWLLMSGLLAAPLTPIVLTTLVYRTNSTAEPSRADSAALASSICFYGVAGFFIYLGSFTVIRHAIQ